MKTMRKKLVNQKRDELKEWSKKDVVEHIRSYPDQDRLNYDDEGNKKNHQVGIMAEVIAQNNYKMTDNQYYSMVDGYAKTVVPEMKVVGVSFRKPHVENFKMNLVGERKDGVVSTYDVDYHLKPEPDNEYDPKAVGVWVENKNNELEQVGYLSKDFVNEHQIEEQVVQGLMEDHSNGSFKNMSYQIALDTEPVALNPDMNKLATEHEYTLIEDYEQDDDSTQYDDLESALDDLSDLNTDLQL